MFRASTVFAGSLTLLACGSGTPDLLLEPVSVDALPDEATKRGLDYINRSGEPHKATVLEANGAGVALLDLERDDDLDLVFAQGLGSLTELTQGGGADLEVYLNDGAGRFARAPGPGLSGWWTGLASGDLDGDGDADLVAAGFGDLTVLLQQEDGRLVRREASGIEPQQGPGLPAWSTSLALFDADLDGLLDLYVGRYLELDPEDPPLGSLGEGALEIPCRWKEREVFCGPRGLVPQADSLYFGLGDGSFRETTAERLDSPTSGYTLGVIAFDVDRDGDSDLVVANDSSPNALWINVEGPDGRPGWFRDQAFLAGVALSQDGRAEAGMGLAFGDVDRDGHFDLAVTNFSGEANALYLGRADGFDEVTHRYGLFRYTRALLSWSVHLFDVDGDGWLEMFSANGHVYPQADGEHTGTSYGQADSLWRLGPEPIAQPMRVAEEGSILSAISGTRGSALGDVDGDGDPDLVLTRIDGPAALGINRTGAKHHRLSVRCLGPLETPEAQDRHTPRDGNGASVELTAGEARWVAETRTAMGYQSASSPWLHFGLGERATYDALRVMWPSGRVEELPGGATDERLWIREGEGVVRREATR